MDRVQHRLDVVEASAVPRKRDPEAAHHLHPRARIELEASRIARLLSCRLCLGIHGSSFFHVSTHALRIAEPESDCTGALQRLREQEARVADHAGRSAAEGGELAHPPQRQGTSAGSLTPLPLRLHGHSFPMIAALSQLARRTPLLRLTTTRTYPLFSLHCAAAAAASGGEPPPGGAQGQDGDLREGQERVRDPFPHQHTKGALPTRFCPATPYSPPPPSRSCLQELEEARSLYDLTNRVRRALARSELPRLALSHEPGGLCFQPHLIPDAPPRTRAAPRSSR